MVAGAAVMGGLVYGGQFIFYNGRTVAAYERGERALGCIDEAATGLRDVVPARLADDAKRLEAVLTRTPPRVRPLLAEVAEARDGVASALRAGTSREADIAAINRYEATRAVDPAPIARALRDEARALDEARRQLATLKPAVAARWRRELIQLASVTNRVGQLRQRAEDLARAEVAARAARAVHRAERTAAQETLEVTAQAFDGVAPAAAAAPATAAALAQHREAVERLVRELAGVVDSVHEAVVEEIAKPAPARDGLRQAIARLESVTGVRVETLAPLPPEVSVAAVVVAPAASPAQPLPAAPGAPAAVEPLEPEAAPELIAAALERGNRALAAHGAALGGSVTATAALDRAATGLVRAAATTAPARERLAALAARLGPEAVALVQASAAATTLVRSVDVSGIRARLVSCLVAARAPGSSPGSSS
jgi:hypothetical protein